MKNKLQILCMGGTENEIGEKYNSSKPVLAIIDGII